MRDYQYHGKRNFWRKCKEVKTRYVSALYWNNITTTYCSYQGTLVVFVSKAFLGKVYQDLNFRLSVQGTPPTVAKIFPEYQSKAPIGCLVDCVCFVSPCVGDFFAHSRVSPKVSRVWLKDILRSFQCNMDKKSTCEINALQVENAAFLIHFCGLKSTASWVLIYVR